MIAWKGRARYFTVRAWGTVLTLRSLPVSTSGYDDVVQVADEMEDALEKAHQPALYREFMLAMEWHFVVSVEIDEFPGRLAERPEWDQHPDYSIKGGGRYLCSRCSSI